MTTAKTNLQKKIITPLNNHSQSQLKTTKLRNGIVIKVFIFVFVILITITFDSIRSHQSLILSPLQAQNNAEHVTLLPSQIIITKTSNVEEGQLKLQNHHQQQQQQQQKSGDSLQHKLNVTASDNALSLSNYTTTSSITSSNKNDLLFVIPSNMKNNLPPSPMCFPFQRLVQQSDNTMIKRIYFLHMRKAGGSTLRIYLQRVASFYNLSMATAEASFAEEPFTKSGTLYITHMRDPVKRSLSQYNYDGKWDCWALKNEKYKIQLSLHDWYNNTDIPSKKCKDKVWKCSANCYMRWLNFPKKRCQKRLHPIEDANFMELAFMRAHNQHLIVDMDLLFTDDSYVNSLQSFFGVKGLVGFRKSMFCDKDSKKANSMYPTIVNNQTLQDLYYVNRFDYQLYNNLRHCSSVTFPTNVTLKDFIHRS